jgi:hypothetical protein
MPTVIINGIPIEFPNTGAAPVNSEAQIQFAQAVEAALSGLISTGDVSKQIFTLNASQNIATDVTLTGLSFSASVVRAAFIRYSVYREVTQPASASEAGEMTIIYNANNPTNQKWELQQERIGDANISFTVDDNGQFYFSTTSIGTGTHSGAVAFVAQSLSQS